MKLLFAHDIRVINSEGIYYFDASYSIGVFERYFKYFDRITFLSRSTTKDDVKNTLTPILDDRIVFEGINNYNELFYSETKKRIQQLIDSSDVVIIRLPSTMGRFVEKYARKSNKIIIVEMVGCVLGSLWNHSWKGKIIAPYYFLKLRLLLLRASNTIYVTESFLQKRYPTRGKFIGCSDVDLGQIDNMILEKRIHKIKNMEKDHKIILGTIGAVYVKYKGQRYVLEAMAKLIKKGYNLEYQLVGGGSDEKLRRLAQKLGIIDHVIFKGSLKHQDIFEWLDLIDIYIQPSDTEGLPRSIVEALSRACPVIGTNVGGIPELIEKNFIFKRKNTDDLGRVMINMINGNLIDRAIASFKRAKDFDKAILDQRRDLFYKEIFENANH
ncbi:MAG: glycosyl transferase [Firmicutes bacterium HGW-Firmicutes-1]|jgi:glycosyltransferase involved in cell wall biosynthesis|nr:MAG: glycosyl transferase [Firmicutes bacterium HGW-Firmicutes-1]